MCFIAYKGVESDKIVFSSDLMNYLALELLKKNWIALDY